VAGGASRGKKRTKLRILRGTTVDKVKSGAGGGKFLVPWESAKKCALAGKAGRLK
jgi:hypothetical protein